MHLSCESGEIATRKASINRAKSMYYGLRAAQRLKAHRTSLRKQHARLRALLHAADTPVQQVCDSIEHLRLLYRQSLTDSIEVHRTFSQRVVSLNLLACFKAMIAGRHLHATCNEVAETLKELDRSETHPT
jgi:hypothetical protein